MKVINRLVSLEWLILLIFALAMGLYFSSPIADPDTPWHYETGIYILSHHSIPSVDVFSWSAKGSPWFNHEWLFEVMFAWVGTHFGFAGTWLFRTIDMAITLIALYTLGVRVSNGNRVMSALLASIGVCGGAIFWTMRPQILSYMLFAVFLLLLQLVREGKFKVLLLVPPLMLFWANSHASYVLGLLFILLEVVISFVPSIGNLSKTDLPKGARLRLLIVTVIGAGMALINPNGIKAYTATELFMGNALNVNYIKEWATPNFHESMFKFGILPFIVLLFILVAIRVRKLPIRDVVFFAGCLTEFLISERFLPYLMIVAVPMAATLTSDWLRKLDQQPLLIRSFNTLISVVWLGTFLFHTIPAMKGSVSDHLNTDIYPVAAVNYMKKHHLTNHVLNYYSYGGYLILRGIPTFVDGRTDPFLNNGIFANYIQLQYLGQQTPSLLDKYHFKTVLFPVGSSLVMYLTHTGNWKIAYSDNVADVLVPSHK